MIGYNDGIKNLLIEQIFYQKYTAKNYEISSEFLKEIKVSPYSNCLYCCISLYFYHNEEHHMEIRRKVFDYIKNNKQQIYIYFQGIESESNNLADNEELLNEYIIRHNIEWAFAGDSEYSAIILLYKLKYYYLKRILRI